MRGAVTAVASQPNENRQFATIDARTIRQRPQKQNVYAANSLEDLDLIRVGLKTA